MYSLGSSCSRTGPLQTVKELGQTRHLSTSMFNNVRFNPDKKFPEFKYNTQKQNYSNYCTDTNLNHTKEDDMTQPKKNSPGKKWRGRDLSKTKKNRLLMEEIDEVGVDACEGVIVATPETPSKFASCPLKIALTEFIVRCASPRSSFSTPPAITTTNPSVSPRQSLSSTNSSPMEFVNFSWFAAPKNCISFPFRKRIASDCQSEDSFVVFTSDGEEEDDDDKGIDSECFGSDTDNTCYSDDESEGDDECMMICMDKKRIVPDVVDKKIKKKVMFQSRDKLCEVHPMVTWSFAYKLARKGHWEELGRDRDRFQARIGNVAATIDRILTREHRDAVFRDRFEQ